MRSAEARTRLEASYGANSSLEECALRPVPQLATGKRRAVSSASKRFGRIGAANKGFIAMMRLSLI